MLLTENMHITRYNKHGRNNTVDNCIVICHNENTCTPEIIEAAEIHSEGEDCISTFSLSLLNKKLWYLDTCTFTTSTKKLFVVAV